MIYGILEIRDQLLNGITFVNYPISMQSENLPGQALIFLIKIDASDIAFVFQSSH